MTYNQNRVKNLDLLKCDLKDVIIVDNDPKSYLMHPLNGLPILPWFEDKEDNKLKLISKILIYLSKVDDVRKYIPQFVTNDAICFENVDKLLYKSKMECKYEQILSSKQSTIGEVTPKKYSPLKRKLKTKEKFLYNSFFAPDEFINPLDRNQTSSRKLNQVRLFTINKNFFSNFNNESNQTFHIKGNLSCNFLDSEIINTIHLENNKDKKLSKKNEITSISSESKINPVCGSKPDSDLKIEPLNLMKNFEGNYNEGFKGEEVNEMKESNDFLYFE